jgi:transcriptional antiterminator NusG
VPLTEKEVAALGVELGDDSGVKTISVDYKVGDNVVITKGSFEDLVGVVSEINLEEQTAVVTIKYLGRETPVSMPISQIKAED